MTTSLQPVYALAPGANLDAYVHAVNGIPLDGPQRQAELMNSLRDARSLQLTVRRDGSEQQIGVDLK